MPDLAMGGVCWSCTLETSELPREIGLPEPEWRKVGKGHRVIWHDLTQEQVEAIVQHVSTIYDTSSGWDMEDSGTIRDRAAMRGWLRQQGLDPF